MKDDEFELVLDSIQKAADFIHLSGRPCRRLNKLTKRAAYLHYESIAVLIEIRNLMDEIGITIPEIGGG